jgi:hypothetical protein
MHSASGLRPASKGRGGSQTRGAHRARLTVCEILRGSARLLTRTARLLTRCPSPQRFVLHVMLKQIGSARAARAIWINRERGALPALPLTYSRSITYGRARFWAFEPFREDATRLVWSSFFSDNAHDMPRERVAALLVVGEIDGAEKKACAGMARGVPQGAVVVDDDHDDGSTAGEVVLRRGPTDRIDAVAPGIAVDVPTQGRR